MYVNMCILLVVSQLSTPKRSAINKSFSIAFFAIFFYISFVCAPFARFRKSFALAQLLSLCVLRMSLCAAAHTFLTLLGSTR